MQEAWGKSSGGGRGYVVSRSRLVLNGHTEHRFLIPTQRMVVLAILHRFTRFMS